MEKFNNLFGNKKQTKPWNPQWTSQTAMPGCQSLQLLSPALPPGGRTAVKLGLLGQVGGNRNKALLTTNEIFTLQLPRSSLILVYEMTLFFFGWFRSKEEVSQKGLPTCPGHQPSNLRCPWGLAHFIEVIPTKSSKFMTSCAEIIQDTNTSRTKSSTYWIKIWLCLNMRKSSKQMLHLFSSLWLRQSLKPGLPTNIEATVSPVTPLKRTRLASLSPRAG